MVEKWPCEHCGVPMVSTFAFCPSCGKPPTGSTAPAPPPVVNRDVEHLKMLGIFHYIMAGLSAMMGTFPVLHLILGIVMLNSDDFNRPGSGNEPGPEAIAWMFIGMASVFILGGWTAAVLQFLAGRNLRAHRRKGFCTVVAALSCISIPLGTILGIFTLVVLARPTVAPLFDAETDRTAPE